MAEEMEVTGNNYNTVICDKAELERYERVQGTKKITPPGGRTKDVRESNL